ncbi:MAG: response regulator [Rhodobacteraceae bacterium]|nr:response regulator [Paracoccaceae bacterium]
MPIHKNTIEGVERIAPPPLEEEAMALLDHDLRSAISDVFGGLQLLDTAQMPEKDKTQIERIAASAALALRLMEASQGYWLSQQVPPLDPDNAAVSVLSLLNELEMRWRGRAAARGLSLVFNLEIDESLELAFDDLELQRLLSNLLENAVKFTEQGQITLTAHQSSSHVVIRVLDEGPGFNPASLSKLFTFGGRPEDSLKPGSGFGLFIAKSIVEQMRGWISAENIETGALVSVEIPLDLMAKPSKVEVSPKPPHPHLAGLRVLLAEDNATNQIVAGQMLQALGAGVTIANDGVEAWELLQQQVFDVALIDVEMPHKSGLQLIREIREGPETIANMPLIVLTAYVMREHRQRILQAGADGIIAKPLASIEAFGEAIQKYCRRSGLIFSPPKETAGTGPVDKKTYDALRQAVGDKVFGDLLGKLLIDLENVEKCLCGAFAQQDTEQARLASHNLVSLAGAIGAADLLEVARSLNSAAQRSDCEIREQFQKGTLKLLSELKDFLHTALSEFQGD